MEPPRIDKSSNPAQAYVDKVQERIKQNKASNKKNEDNLGDTGIDPELSAKLRKQRYKCEKEDVCN